ncbi:siderophore-interacting protein [Microbacterium sp. NPDC086615]|uniref:siderophore-interacting protein n=1 Tax=Microbacterium sp. NPDC086615 TaxID=3154865 RepID=UPI003435E228
MPGVVADAAAGASRSGGDRMPAAGAAAEPDGSSMAGTEIPPSASRPWEYSAFPVTVARREMLSPNFVRLTFSGDALQHFAPWGLDQRIKLVLPLPGGGLAEFGLLDDPTPHPSEWYTRWKALPPDERNVLRTYTPAAIRPGAGEIDVDIYLHSPDGPASRWARGAHVGETLVITGPDVRNGWTGYGIHWQPPEKYTSFLLVADETAIPAVRGIAASLPPAARGIAIVEIGDHADDLTVAGLSPQVDVRVVGRGETEAAVRAWATPDVDVAWLAGESGVVTASRRVLVRELGVPRERVAFLGYWREGGALVD